MIDVLRADDIDKLEALWRELLDHHLADAPHLAMLGPARTPRDSWRMRRGQYLQWLAAPKATVLVAQDSVRPVGYAMIRAIDATGSWQWGDQIGILETLVVTSELRGAGVGQALLEAARNRLADWGIQVLTISVIAGNEAALRFYRREGASHYLHTLVMPTSNRLAQGHRSPGRRPDFAQPCRGPDPI
jgi:ribosomal protein S18 acetylase RimI-like enzyme